MLLKCLAAVSILFNFDLNNILNTRNLCLVIEPFVFFYSKLLQDFINTMFFLLSKIFLKIYIRYFQGRLRKY